MDLRALEAFVLVLREGGVTRAAARLGVTQPAISARLRTLEQLVGQPLLVRRRGRLQLTAAGRELLARAEPLVALAEDVQSWIRDAGRLGAGRLCLGADGPFGVMPLLAAFRRCHPRIAVELRIGNTAHVMGELRAGVTDAAVVMLDDPVPDLETALLSRDRLYALLPAGHRLARDAALPLAQLVAEPLVLRERGSATRALFEAAAARAGLRLQPVLELGSREAVREAVAAGLGAAVVFGEEQPPDPRLVVIPVPELERPIPRVLACLPGRRHLRVNEALYRLAEALSTAGPARLPAGIRGAP